MKLLYMLLKQDPATREGVITATSALGLIVNIVISVIKIAIGAAVSSIAIISEGLHSAADAMTSVLTIAGVKLSAKRPTKKHPFGYGRVEYLTSLVIAGLILFTGMEVLLASVDLLFHPVELDISVLTLAIVAATAAVKFLLGVYTMRKGREVGSESLTGVGAECRNDSFASIITIGSAVIFLVSGVSVDAVAGMLTALIILKTGGEILLSTLSDLLGRAGNHELAQTLYQQIRATPGVRNAADMMLHNYGPDAYAASVNIEIDHARTIGDVYQDIHELQLRILHEHRVTMVFGIYAVDEDHEESRALRRDIAAFVRANEHVKSYHALYHDKKARRIYCDFVVEYGDFSWDALRAAFEDYMAQRYPGDSVELVIETEFV